MSESWYFKCLKCEERNNDGLNHGDKILVGVLHCIDAIKNLLDRDESGYLEISIMNIGMEPIDFLMEHYGDGHDVVVYSEYGKKLKELDNQNMVNNTVKYHHE